ncbi:MAG: hypothetical protein J5517_08910 [Eubacterium sp.]|nr:hypothetical protein [Eubacterium sp.]
MKNDTIKNEKQVSIKWVRIFIYTTFLFAISFIALLIFGGHTGKILSRFGLKSEVIQANDTALGWNRCMDYMNIDSDIVMIGDSITSGCDFSKYFDDKVICNLGIPGDTILGLTERSYMVETVKPEKVFVLIGINGLTNYNTNIMYKQYEEMVDSICERTDAEIYLISILPVSKGREKEKSCSNSTIKSFNEKIKQLADSKGLKYIDLNSKLLKDGVINPAYSSDGIHLTEKAYDIWAETISDYIE